MSEIVIEKYSDLYKAGVCELILEIQQKEFQIDIDIESQPDLLDIPRFYQRNKGNFWIAKSANAVVGTIALLDIGNNQGALRKMFVSRQYRGKEYGVAQQLLNTLLTWAKANRVTGIFLGTTEKFIAAHRFYEKNGFAEINKSQLPEKFPVMSVDVKFYRFRQPMITG